MRESSLLHLLGTTSFYSLRFMNDFDHTLGAIGNAGIGTAITDFNP
jgi:hypothetical protein